MSKLFSNKKVMLGVVSVMVGVTILMAGLTYAWFTNSGTAVRDDITMGTLKMDVTLKDADMFSFDEPGGGFGNQVAYIQNLGTVPTLAKLKFVVTTTIKSDSNGDPLSSWYTIENDPKIKVTLQEDGVKGDYTYFPETKPDGVPLGIWFTEDGEYYFWYNYNGEYYVLMTLTTDESGVHPQPGMKIPFNYSVDLSKDMGNEYQNADVDIKVEWIATQSLAEESYTEVLGIAEEDVATFLNDEAFIIGGGERFIQVEDYLK